MTEGEFSYVNIITGIPVLISVIECQSLYSAGRANLFNISDSV